MKKFNQIEIMELVNLIMKVKRKRQLSNARAVKPKIILLQSCR